MLERKGGGDAENVCARRSHEGRPLSSTPQLLTMRRARGGTQMEGAPEDAPGRGSVSSPVSSMGGM